MVEAGDLVCIYLSGLGSIVANARIEKVQAWSRDFAATYPFTLGGTPELVLCLVDVQLLSQPVAAATLVDQLDCVGANKQKWGAAFCGGMRSLTAHDYRLLTSRDEH